MSAHARGFRLLTHLVVAALVSGMLAVTTALLGAAPAQAAGSPDLQLSGGPAADVLYGETVPVALTASLPAGAPKGYNLAYRFVLPAGTSYVGASAGEEAGEPTVLADAPTSGKTTLIWPNTYDLVANASHTLAFEVRYNTTAAATPPRYDVGSPLAIDMGAYLSSDPRDLADFSALGVPQPGPDSYSGHAAKSTITKLTAIEIEKSEPHPEGEIPRGVHDHQTVYTLTVTNNKVNPTTGVTVDDYLPAGLEFLGCAGTADHTTDAPTNPGSAEEYAGSGPIVVSQPTTDCVDPVLVETVDTDPDGSGPLPAGVYTHVRWTHLGGFGADQVKKIRYAAAIPIRENTLTWTTPGGTPATTGAQAVNLDNNSGPETYDEQPLLNGAIAAGDYQSPIDGPRAVSDEGTLLRTAEDIAIQKSNDNNGLEQGDLTKWTVDLQVSEYRYVDHVVVRDTVPNGLCPLGTGNLTTQNNATDAECAPTAGKLPSQPYSSVAEQSDGTFAIVWDESTYPALARLAPSATRQLTFWTRTRANYQGGFLDTTPVLSKDAVTNNIATEGVDWVRCAPADPTCAGSGTKLDHDETDGELDFDVSQSGKAAEGPAILKQVAATYPASGDCDDLVAADYGKTVPAYGPGDLVCWKLRLTFPTHLDTFSQDVFDILPASLSYVPGTWQETTNNTVDITAFDDTADDTAGRLGWKIGGGGTDVDTGGEIFEVTLKTTVGSPLGHHSGDVEGNLQKFSYQNTAGKAFTLRDLVDFELTLPELGVTKTADDEEVEAGQAVGYTVGVRNTGTAPAQDARVWDVLPSGFTCAEISTISDGGSCTGGRITWTGVDVAAGATKNLTYTVTVPSDVSPGVAYTNRVGVVEYGYTTNSGTTYQLIPANPVVKDPFLPTPNMPAAEATETIRTRDANVVKGRTTSVNESGNNAGSQATIGEVVTYTVVTTIPKNTTTYGAKVTDPLGSRQTLVPGSLCVNGCTLDGVAFGGVTESPANTVLATLPATYAAPTATDGVLVLTFQAKVLDVAANTRGTNLGNTATLAYTDQDGAPHTRSGTVNTTIVEPKIAVAKTVAGPTVVTSGEVKTFTVTASNTSGSNVSTAHDVVVVDTLPAGTEPVTIHNGGVWNSATRTITWTHASLAPGASTAFTYTVQVEDPAVGGTTYKNTVLATSTSQPNATGGVRTPASTATTAGDYDATAEKTISVVLPGITKDVSPTTATIGDNLTWTVRVTVPANVRYFDTTVVDTVPDGLAVDGYGAITCTAGCPGTDPAVSTFPVTTSGATQQAAWFLGDLAPAAQQRTYELVLTGHVLSTKRGGGSVTAPVSFTNQATVRTNRTDTMPATPTSVPASYSDTVTPATATTAVKEPTLTIDKAADKGPRVEGDDTVTYTVKVKNTGSWPAYDVVVTDQPDTELVDVTLVGGAALSTDGWTAGDPDLRWLVPGPIAAGATVTFTYTAKVKPGAQLNAGDQVTNTAAIPSYFGASTATRTGDGDNPWREYVGPQDTVTLTVVKPNLTIAKTPDNGAATAGEDATFTITVKNTDAHATAHGVVVHDVLPAGLTYVSSTPSGTASGSTVDWTIGTLAPGASKTITVVARVGSDVATGTTLTNTASTHADEVPTDKTDTGSLVVGTKTDLKVIKTASKTSVLAGEQLGYTLTTTNVGPSDALASTLTDTLPAYLTFVSLDDEERCSVTGQVVSCDYGTLAPGATRTVHVTVQVDPARTTPVTNAVDVTTTTPDTAPGNNHSQVTTPVTPVADVSVTKTADGVDYEGGDTVTYTLVARNDGPSTAQNVTLTDPLPADLTFVSVTPGAPTCTQAAGTVSCAFGALAPGAERTVTIAAKAKGTPPVPAVDSHDHQLDVSKSEQYVSLQAGETRTQDLSCTGGATMTDGSVGVMSVDQGTGTKADVVVREARSTSLGTYRFVVTNHATGQAQVKLFGTCLAGSTTTVAGHAHDIAVGSLQTLGTGALAVGRHDVTLPVAAGTRAVAPGIEVLSGQARLVAAEPVAGGWRFTVDVITPAQATLSIRALQTRTAMGGTPSHLHGLDLEHVTRTVTLAPGESVERVGCPVGFKGITATYDLPAGVLPLGHEPQPVNRDFRLLNTTDGPLDVLLDLECIGIRTGPELAEVLTVVNIAEVATTTYDADAANDTGSATVTLARAAGSVTPAPAPGPAPAPAAPVSAVGAFRVVSASRGATVRVACAGSGVCTGTVTLTAVIAKRHGRAKRIVIGTARYRVLAGGTDRVRVTIKKRFRQDVRHDRARRFRIG
ncbi:isopeptide-forming domain-containing fimbrial protein [Nocardioides sp. W7]|uniref:isopeptide-forming domain-containing fimbrial protein n=1 Tax=Nocardioides sp. W7 TaxID=2931390 RepID=UPI001FD3EAEF|nr:isopeptide-forming domain-containing fimbrial protein [Nocardioides sp. W7]